MCKGWLIRIWRRPVDRLYSYFVPVHRFRCENFSCGWEGNFRVDGHGSGKNSDVLTLVTTASFAAFLVLTSVVLALLLAASTIDWLSSL